MMNGWTGLNVLWQRPHKNSHALKKRVHFKWGKQNRPPKYPTIGMYFVKLYINTGTLFANWRHHPVSSLCSTHSFPQFIISVCTKVTIKTSRLLLEVYWIALNSTSREKRSFLANISECSIEVQWAAFDLLTDCHIKVIITTIHGIYQTKQSR